MVQSNINLYFLSLRADTPKKDFWDYGLLYDITAGFQSLEVDSLPECEAAIVVIPARSHAELVGQVNQELAKVKAVVLFLMGDEEGDFPVEKIKHKNIKIWVQNPQPGRHDKYRRIGTGYPPQMHGLKGEQAPIKDLNWFFAGQVTHYRRLECVQELRSLGGGVLVESQGFTQGLPHPDYFEKMKHAKVCPCPSGPETPDSFRLFEALELGAIPIADTQTPTEEWLGFWEWLFDEPVPFPTIKDWTSLPGYIQDCVAKYPELNNDIQAWWIGYKTKLRKYLIQDIRDLGVEFETSPVTVIIPVSPIPSHPDISILEETIKNVRFHLPFSEIMLTFDGARPEHQEKVADYNEHIRRMLWEVSGYGNVTPVIFKQHMHQVGMARAVIDRVSTPLILYVEQDTPLVIDEPIEWELINNFVLSGESNLVRFHFEGHVPDEHRSLMIGKPEGGFLKTVQWSQRPHVASTAFYRRILAENFTDKSRCFIEDLMHGKVSEDWLKYGEQGWNQWRLHIYHPEKDKNIKRSYHTDGRAGSNKLDETQVW